MHSHVHSFILGVLFAFKLGAAFLDQALWNWVFPFCTYIQIGNDNGLSGKYNKDCSFMGGTIVMQNEDKLRKSVHEIIMMSDDVTAYV